VREATAAGFRDAVARPFTGAIHVESAEEYVAFVARSAPPIVALRTKMGASWPAIEQRVLASVRRHVPGPTDLTAEAIFTTGVR